MEQTFVSVVLGSSSGEGRIEGLVCVVRLVVVCSSNSRGTVGDWEPEFRVVLKTVFSVAESIPSHFSCPEDPLPPCRGSGFTLALSLVTRVPRFVSPGLTVRPLRAQGRGNRVREHAHLHPKRRPRTHAV